jgi:hypothetical protein
MYPLARGVNAGVLEIAGGGYAARDERWHMAHDDYESTVERAEERPKVTQTPPPGPADHGGQGGMATREKAPELAVDGEESVRE